LKRHDVAMLAVILILMLLPRIALAPYTCGSDIAQFAGFADSFLRHKLCFYSYDDIEHSYSENWPYNWLYVYGPGLILLLAPLRELSPSPIIHYWDQSGYHVFVPLNWIIASKSLFISFDLLSTLMLYVIVRKMGLGEKYSALMTSLYAFNPITIYISSIYGMFDQIPLFLFLLGVYLMYLRGGDNVNLVVGSFIVGMSLAFKHTLLLPALMIFYDILIRRENRMRLIMSSSLITGGILLFIPFIVACPSSLWNMIRMVSTQSKPYYTLPLSYSFNGISSLATYIHMTTGRDTIALISLWWVPTIVLTIVLLILYKRCRDPILFTGISYIVFTATYWRINYQYLVPAVAFAILLAVRLRDYRRIVILAFVYILTVGLWTILFPISWWTHVHIENPNISLWRLLDRLSLMVFNDKVYVIYSLFLTALEYLLIILTLLVILFHKHG
jgi:Gpi18-like mannosyltransferase